MTVSCADCSKCGKCYPKKRPCPSCGSTIDYSADERCPSCGTPVTQAMIDKAMAEYRDLKRREFEQFFGVRKINRPHKPASADDDNGQRMATPVVRVLGSK